MIARNPRLRRLLLALAVPAIGIAAPATPRAEQVDSPLGPQASLAHFQLDAGLEIELVASEPQVVDPIAIRFDEDGRLWVVEMRDYPHGPEKGQPPLSKIRVLTDNDGDGFYETSSTFAEGLLFPTGLQPWRGGLIVTLAGEVAYLKDTTGDGRADLHETWYRGFATENPQLRANRPRFGLDHRVYVANGLRGGDVVDPRHDAFEPISISGRDFSFDPRSGRCEAISGNGQFGLTFDDFGNRFVCSNRNPLDHVVLENRYLARNPLLAVPGVLHVVAAAGNASRVYPLIDAWTTSNLHAGQFTAACGAEIYRAGALGDAYRGNAFICEPTGSLVQRQLLWPAGVTFAAKPAYAEREFLASRDEWFRPVYLESGPDGSLYVVDMYRAVIEHPQFMPSELQQRDDLRRGDDRGRIYRIAAAGAKPQDAPRLSTASSVDLVALLAHESAWWRETAARLLYERQDKQAAPHIERLIANAAQPTARIHALWALSGIEALSAAALLSALDDRDPRVREQAIVLAESLLERDTAIRESVIALSADTDARVRFRVALAIGGLNSDEAAVPLAQIALSSADDPWMRRAVATALPEHAASVLAEVLDCDRLADAKIDSSELSLIQELAAIVGSRRDPTEIRRLLLQIGDDSTGALAHEAALLGLADGLARRGGGLVDFVARLPDAALVQQQLTATFDRAATAALDERLADDARAGKLDLLKHARNDRATSVCLQIVDESPSQRLRQRAAAALAAHADKSIGPALLRSYPTQTPAVRRAILDALVAQPASALLLLDAVQSTRFARAELDAGRETRLKKHRDEAVRKRAATVLTTAVSAERAAVLADYQASLSLEGDALAGKALFRQHCAACHKIGDVGVDVGPDISDSRVKTPLQLLTDILHPNQAIDNNYVSYTVVTTDGNVHTGIIASETAASITLRQQENKTLSLLRADIDSIVSSGVSLMPEGFEKHLSHQQMADLIGFIKNWRYLEQPIGDKIRASNTAK